MPLPKFLSKTNKSTASLDKIQEPSDQNSALREQAARRQLHQQQIHQQQQEQQQQQQQPASVQTQQAQQVQHENEAAATGAYSPSQQGQQQYVAPSYQQHAPSQPRQQNQYTIQSNLPDELYYSEQQQQQQHPGHVLDRSSSHRLSQGVPVNAYQEQRQLHAHAQAQSPQQHQQGQRLTIQVVPSENSLEEDQHPPGQTQFGASQRQNIVKSKDEKKQRNSHSSFRGLLGISKDKSQKQPQPESPKPSRHGSVLRRGQAAPSSPQSAHHTVTHEAPNLPQSPQRDQSASIAAYQGQQFHQESSQEDLGIADDQRDEAYYRRSNSQYEQPSSQPSSQQSNRPPVQYHEDAPHFPPPNTQYQPQAQSLPQAQAQAQTQQQQQQQHYHQHQPSLLQQHNQQQQQQSQTAAYHHPNVSQTQVDRVSADERDRYLPYTQQPIRDRPSTAFEADRGLRPPSPSSLGPPSPLGGTATLAVRQASAAGATPRYSTQSFQPYQSPPQETNKSSQPQPQPQSPSDFETQPQSLKPAPLPSQSQLPPRPSDSPPVSAPEADMPSGRGERAGPLRDPRMDEQDQRYQLQDPRLRMSTAPDHTGRNTPPPRGGRGEDAQSMDHQTLLSRYEELQAKYSKVKRYYFDREAQVTQLQNTVANQRLSMSKTSLDDAQYVQRFERLNGAIQNLSFNIRKDWRRIPNWLVPACNRDACATGTKEMTAIGRAVISRWLFERIFQEIFHPGIDQRLSHKLKLMERNLRHSPSGTMLTEEQRDDLLTKVTTWRLTTCESLADDLKDSEAYIDSLLNELSNGLNAYLRSLLNDPPPPNLDSYLGPIVSQALAISANLPQESRDICIDYAFPGAPFNETLMKLEPGMTPLTTPGSSASSKDHDPEDDDDQGSNTSDVDSSEDKMREAIKAATNNAATTGTSTSSKESKRGKGIFGAGGFAGGIVNKKNSTTQSQQKADAEMKGQAGGKDDEHLWNIDAMTRGQKEGKIRFAVFFAVEIRGKSAKAAEASQSGSGNGNGNGDSKHVGQGNGASAGSGVPGASSGGTSGGVGTGGQNVLYKAPVYGF